MVACSIPGRRPGSWFFCNWSRLHGLKVPLTPNLFLKNINHHIFWSNYLQTFFDLVKSSVFCAQLKYRNLAYWRLHFGSRPSCKGHGSTSCCDVDFGTPILIFTLFIKTILQSIVLRLTKSATKCLKDAL